LNSPLLLLRSRCDRHGWWKWGKCRSNFQQLVETILSVSYKTKQVKSTEPALRTEIVAIMRKMADRGLNRGTSGNVSVRCRDGLLVTPSGIVPEDLTPESMVFIDNQGVPETGALVPSSEWQMHKGILDRRTDIHAVVHCHSHYATVLACANRAVPAMHYMVGVVGGASIDVAPYHMFGSPELAEAVVNTLEGRYACLMSNHGQIAVAKNLARAYSITEQVEEQASIYWGTLAIGGPVLLSDEQMQAILQQFKTYGQRK
jgi:L-fuculose-phosphate aldolase